MVDRAEIFSPHEKLLYEINLEIVRVINFLKSGNCQYECKILNFMLISNMFIYLSENIHFKI